MDMPVVGVTPLYDYSKNSIWMLPGYLKGLEQAGALPVVLPLTSGEEELERALSLCNGVLFTGGQDVNPAIYGQDRLPVCGEISAERDGEERYLLKRCIERDIPLLGICRGIQFINAALGGTLFQDLPAQHAGGVNHCMTPPYDRPVHRVTFPVGSPLAAIVGRDCAQVNSYHHQAVKDLAPRLRVSAVSEDGLTEGVYLPEARFLHAVQWHPEFDYMVNADSRAIFSAFVKSCRAAE